LMVMNSQLMDMAFSRAAVSDVRQAAMDSGMHSLLMDGRRKILNGITTPEELYRITQA